jgi:hypothetical protein
METNLTSKEQTLLAAIQEGMDEPGCGWLHEFPSGVVMQNSYYDDGTIVIGGTVFIDTDPSYEEDDYYEDDEE